MSNGYDHNRHDSAETCAKKAESARRGIAPRHSKAKAERARIAANIERIGQANDALEGGITHPDVIWLMSRVRTGGFLKCTKIG